MFRIISVLLISLGIIPSGMAQRNDQVIFQTTLKSIQQSYQNPAPIKLQQKKSEVRSVAPARKLRKVTVYKQQYGNHPRAPASITDYPKIPPRLYMGVNNQGYFYMANERFENNGWQFNEAYGRFED